MGHAEASDYLCEARLDEAGAAKGPRSLSKKVRSQITGFHLARTLHHLDLERIGEMKTIVADAIGVPRQRLCEQVLGYSPALQSVLVDQYIDNFEYAAAQLSTPNAPRPLAERARARLYKNKLI